MLKKINLRVACEIFADRAYEEDGTLVNRKKDGAMIHDEDIAVKRMIRAVKEGKIEAITGKDIEVEVDSICVHGDNEKAVLFSKKIKEALEEEGINILPLDVFIKR